MNNDYLIPANSKKSMLILGFFTPIDLIVFGAGATVTMGMLMIVQSTNIWTMILILTPAIIATFLVMPIPNYHNMMQLLSNIVMFYSNRRRYYWKGWCARDGETETINK